MKKTAAIEKKHNSRLIQRVGCTLLFACIYFTVLLSFGSVSDDFDAADYAPDVAEQEFQPVDDVPEENNKLDLSLTSSQKNQRTALRRTAKTNACNNADALNRGNCWILKLHAPTEHFSRNLSFLPFQCTNNLFVRDGPGVM